MSTWAFEPEGPDRTAVRSTFGARLTSLPARLFLTLVGWAAIRGVRKAIRGDLDGLAAAAERAA